MSADENPNLKGLVLSSSRWLQSSTSSSYDCYYGIGISIPSVKQMPVDNGEEFTIATSESLSLSSRSVIGRTDARIRFMIYLITSALSDIKDIHEAYK